MASIFSSNFANSGWRVSGLWLVNFVGGFLLGLRRRSILPRAHNLGQWPEWSQRLHSLQSRGVRMAVLCGSLSAVLSSVFVIPS